MTERVLGAGELRLALLARQRLLERGTAGVGVVHRIGGLQTQSAPSGYVGLWSRAARRDGSSIERSAYTEALRRGSLVQGTLMRHTIHTVARADYWPFALAVRGARRRSWLQATRHARSPAVLERLARRTAELLSDGPRQRGELVAALGVDGTTWNGVHAWLDLVRVPPSGTWERRRADLIELADRWVGSPPELSEADAGSILVASYLAGFGPSSKKDVASYTGLPLAAIDEALGRLRLRRFRDVQGGELVDVRGAALPDPDTPVPVRFLPTWDATLLVHARRTDVVPEDVRPRIFNTKMPQSVATFLVDGRVAGTWTMDDGIRVEPFRRLPASVRRAVDEEADRLAAFVS